HPNAVVLAALVLAQQRILLGIEEVRVRIEHVQHARNGSVINGLVGVDRFGIILLDQVVHLRELMQAVAHIGIAARRRRGIELLAIQHAQEAAGYKHKNYQDERATRTTDHRLFSFSWSVRARHETASLRSIAWGPPGTSAVFLPKVTSRVSAC